MIFCLFNSLVFNRNNFLENALSVILAIAIGVLGGVILALDFYRDFFTFLFCFVIASCHYSLLKVGADCGAVSAGFAVRWYLNSKTKVLQSK